MNVLGIHSSYVCDDHGFANRCGVDGVLSARAWGDAGGSADCTAARLKTTWPDALWGKPNLCETRSRLQQARA